MFFLLYGFETFEKVNRDEIVFEVLKNNFQGVE
jgi:hypothetical protein